jgi:hypothetical protein
MHPVNNFFQGISPWFPEVESGRNDEKPWFPEIAELSRMLIYCNQSEID